MSIEEFKENVIETREQFPDFKVEVQSLAAGDRVISRVAYHATCGGKPFNAPVSTSSISKAVW